MKHWTYMLGAILVMICIAFPVPAQAAEKCQKDFQTCIDELVAELKTRGWVGMSVSNIDDRFVVDDMALEGPAKKGGVREGDVVLECNGKKVDRLIDLAGQHSKFKTGDIVSYKLLRDGEEVEVDVLLTEATAPVIGLWIGEHVIQNYVNVDETTERIVP